MSRVLARPVARFAVMAILAAAGVLGLVTAQAAVADDTTVAWSVSPAGPDGVADGRTRLELKTDPGGSVQDRVVISNVSTVARTFSVYGADALNTGTGGYDLKPAATKSSDVGAWITVDTPSVTIPALSSAVAVVTVAVPAGATPGDHPGGIAVSVANPAPDAKGVTIDTRVAVRLNVRVSGELAPALAVRAVRAAYQPTLAPFGRGSTVVSYVVANTGNVRIVGKPRIRITGPFGVQLARRTAADTREILPGQSFTVEAELPGIAPVGVATAVVDVDMAAVPGGPETQIPLVSSTARATFLAPSWTGILLTLLVLAAAVFVVRTVRRRHREGQELWQEMLLEARAGAVERGDVESGPVHQPGSPGDGARRGFLPGRPPLGSAFTVVAALILAAGAVVLGAATVAPSAFAADRTVRLVPSDDPSQAGSLRLDVPSAPKPRAAPGSTTGSAGSGSGAESGSDQSPDSTAPGEGDTTTPSASAADDTPGNSPDMIWAAWIANRRTPAQWAIIGAGTSGVAASIGFLTRNLLLGSRRGRGPLA